MPDATSLSRATSFSVTNVSQFFDSFETVICRHAYELRQIWNLDETDLTTVQKWREKRVVYCHVPPHCSHRMPVDVGVYEPFKRYFNTACDSWMLSHPAKTITIYDIAELSGQTFGKGFSHCNITSSFKATGISVDVNTPAT